MNAIAACEWVFGARETDEVLALLREAGCDGIEVNGEPARDAEALANRLAVAGLHATGTTAICNWPTHDRDLAHPEREARAVRLRISRAAPTSPPRSARRSSASSRRPWGGWTR